MTTMETTQALWQTLPGTEPLFEIYGYWPTLHDATVRKMHVGFAAKELTLVVDYSDHRAGQDNQPEICTRITLRWFGITESTIRLANADLYGINLARIGDLIETRFDDYSFGMDGSIVSAGIEVLQIEPAPEPTEYDDYAIQLSMK
jgi:hypothetical protein